MPLLNSQVELPNALLVAASHAFFRFLRDIFPHSWPVIALPYNFQAFISSSETGWNSKDVSNYPYVDEMC